jgi:hypothetical protein
MANYAKTATNALASIRKAGVSLPIYRPNLTVDQETGETTEGDTLQGTLTGVVLPFKGVMQSGKLDNSFSEALIQGKMRKILAAAKDASFEPFPLDIIEIDGDKFEVVGVNPLAPDGLTKIIYTIIVTRCGTFTPTETP